MSLPSAVFTVDVEDYFQVSGFERQIPRDSWDGFSSRVVDSTRVILELLEERSIRGTFFILGWVAEKFPKLVREIQSAGHEIASHSYWHRLVYELTPEEFRQDLRRSKQVLEDITGEEVTAYRAPSFSITKKSIWALEVLIEEGYKTDSSVFPIHHDRCGIPNAKRHIHRLTTPSGSLVEFPPTVAQVMGMNLPVGGGGYFRLYPGMLTHWGMCRASRDNGHPAMFYIHPWEVDPEQPRLNCGGRATRFRHYVGLKQTARKLQRLAERFQLLAMDDVLNQIATLESVPAPAACA